MEGGQFHNYIYLFIRVGAIGRLCLYFWAFYIQSTQVTPPPGSTDRLGDGHDPVLRRVPGRPGERVPASTTRQGWRHQRGCAGERDDAAGGERRDGAVSRQAGHPTSPAGGHHPEEQQYRRERTLGGQAHGGHLSAAG